MIKICRRGISNKQINRKKKRECRRDISNKQINRKKKREREIKKKENKKGGYIVPNMNRNPRNE